MKNLIAAILLHGCGLVWAKVIGSNLNGAYIINPLSGPNQYISSFNGGMTSLVVSGPVAVRLFGSGLGLLGCFRTKSV